MKRLILLLAIILPLFCYAQFESCVDAYLNHTCGMDQGYEGSSEDFNINTFAFIATDTELEVYIYWECDDLGQAGISPFLDVYSFLSIDECENIVEFSPGCQQGAGPMGESEYTYTGLIIGELYFISLESCEGFPCDFEGYIFMENSGGIQIDEVLMDTPRFSDGCEEDDFLTNQFCADKAITFQADPKAYISSEQRWYVEELGNDGDADDISWSTPSGFAGGGNANITGIVESELEVQITFNTAGKYLVCLEEFFEDCRSYDGDCVEIDIVPIVRSYEAVLCVEDLMNGFVPEPNSEGYAWKGEPLTSEELNMQEGVYSVELYTDECECYLFQELEYELYFPGEPECNSETLDLCPDLNRSIQLSINGNVLPDQTSPYWVNESDEIELILKAENLPKEGRIEWYLAPFPDTQPGSTNDLVATSIISTVTNACDRKPEIIGILYEGERSYVEADSVFKQAEMMLINSGSGFHLDSLVVEVDPNCDETCPAGCFDGVYGLDCGWSSEVDSLFESALGLESGDYVPANSLLVIYFGPSETNTKWESEIAEQLGLCTYVTASSCGNCLDVFSDNGFEVEYAIRTDCGESTLQYTATTQQGAGSYVTKEGLYSQTDNGELPFFIMETEPIESAIVKASFNLSCSLSSVVANPNTVYLRGKLITEDKNCCAAETSDIAFAPVCNTGLRWGPNSSSFLPQDFTVSSTDCPYFLSTEFVDPNTGDLWFLNQVKAESDCPGGVEIYLESLPHYNAEVEEGEYDFIIIAEDNCGDLLIHEFTITVECVDLPGQTDQLFIDYPWVADLIDYPNCDAMVHIEVYDFGAYAYIYIDYGDEAIMYFSDGSRYCKDGPGYVCPDLYGLTTPTYERDCDADPGGGGSGGPLPTDDYPWMTNYIDFDNCLGVLIYFFDFFGSVFPYFEVNGRWTLFSDTGQVYCTDSPPGFICPEVYGLAAPIAVWECGQSCICPAVYDPVCGVDGVTYPNACEAECQGVAIDYTGECSPVVRDPIFDDFPWLEDVVDLPNCTSDETLTVYKSGSYFYIHYQSDTEGILYNSQGQFYCQDGPNYSCVALYGFSASDIVQTWNCSNSIISPDESNLQELTSRSQNLTSHGKDNLDFHLYPNPSLGIVNLRFVNIISKTQVTIHTMDGRLLNKILVEDAEQVLDLSSFGQGVYLIKSSEQGQSVIKKVIIL